MKQIGLIISITLLAMSIISCDTQVEKNNDKVGTEIVVAGPDSYDSKDQAVIVQINKIENTITFYNNQVEKTYTLAYDGASKLTNKFGEALSSEQLQQGQIVDITFLKTKKRLTSLQLISADISYDKITKYTLDLARGTMIIGDDTYNLAKDIFIFSNGVQIEAADIIAGDTLSIYGTGKDIRSIVVEKGHGYISLKNHQQFIGGYIEIGQVQICKITEDMMILIPEGEYNIQVSYKGSGGSLTTRVERNKETVVDIGGFGVPEAQKGTVSFTKTPSNMSVYINGEIVTTKEVTLTYGIYELMAVCDGYETSFSYLKVGNAFTEIDLVLEAKKETPSKEETTKPTTTTTPTPTPSASVTPQSDSTGYTVTINEPVGVAVYVDGSFVGTAPVSFQKVAGSRVITLSKDGYETKSYSIEVNDEEKDVSYVFPELE